MKDKIIQITGVGDKIVALTQSGRMFQKGKGHWTPVKELPARLLELEDVPRFTFGKHRDEPIADADPSYLDWCRGNIDGFRWRKLEDGTLTQDDYSISDEEAKELF